MGVRYRFDAEKAAEVLLYIAEEQSDVYKALKILYFADKQHLARYGRFICGDSYVAMSHGPVPSGAYDLIKYARGDGFHWFDMPIEKAFSVQQDRIIPHRKANRDLLSESDMQCLDAAIKQYGHLSFSELRRLSHDEAFKNADLNDFISLEAIAQTLPDSESLLEYLRDN